METIHDIAGQTRKKPGKARNGDALGYKLLENGLIIMALADGVSSASCDWLASKTACQEFLEACQRELTPDFSQDDVLSICYQVNEKMLQTTDICKGMLTAFVAVLWDTKKDFFHFVSVGDARLYQIRQDQIKQVSQDETKEIVVRRKDGKVLLVDGATLVNTALTNALGSRSFETHLHRAAFAPGDSVVLASDGFYDCKKSFSSDMLALSQAEAPEQALTKLFTTYASDQSDDASVLLLRRNDTDDNLSQDFRSIHDFEKVKERLPRHSLRKLLHEELQACIGQKDKAGSLLVLRRMEEHALFLSQASYDKLLESCEQTGFREPELYQEIIGQIRKARSC